MGEIGTRSEMLEIVERRFIRHAHMVNITPEIMRQGMRADFLAVDAISRKVWELAGKARRIVGETPSGTHIEAEFSPHLRWLKTSGIISPEKWGNLPGGEVLTSPADVNGVYVVDAVVGDYLCERYGDLKETPLRLTIERGRLVDAECRRADLVADFLNYVATDENSNRVGEFAIGTNIGVREPIGNILQDEKLPGIHIAFGNPYPRHTGADWTSSTHIDVVARNWTIWLDDQKIMENGRFLLD
jgi:leucyl aminopeptidase (aminopeptidase T)